MDKILKLIAEQWNGWRKTGKNLRTISCYSGCLIFSIGRSCRGQLLKWRSVAMGFIPAFMMIKKYLWWSKNHPYCCVYFWHNASLMFLAFYISQLCEAVILNQPDWSSLLIKTVDKFYKSRSFPHCLWNSSHSASWRSSIDKLINY